MPLRIDGDLINEAKATGQVFHRSIAQQVEHWASLGRVLEKVLTVSSVTKMKKLSRPVDLERVLTGARSAEGKKKTLALLARKKGALYGIKPGQPNVLQQHRPNGTTVAGRWIKGDFVPARKSSKVKAVR